MKKIPEEMLNDIEMFLLDEYFYHIPAIPVTYSDEIPPCILGVFELEKSDEYDEKSDELINAPGYRHKYISLWDGFGGVDVCGEESWKDPLNHPKASIKINQSESGDIYTLTAVLLHEIIHYANWHMGLDYKDSDREFMDKCREMGAPYGKAYADLKKIEKYLVEYAVNAMKKTA